jgi:hypothetical protein
MNDISGIWKILRYADEETDIQHFAFAYNHFNMSKQEWAEALKQSLQNSNFSSSITWREVDLEKINNSLASVSELGLMYFKKRGQNESKDSDIPESKDEVGVDGIQISSDDLSWNISHMQNIGVILVNSNKKLILDSELLISDLYNEYFSAGLRLDHGMLTAVELPNSAPVKFRYWDVQTLNSIIKKPNAAYSWWEY